MKCFVFKIGFFYTYAVQDRKIKMFDYDNTISKFIAPKFDLVI